MRRTQPTLHQAVRNRSSTCCCSAGSQDSWIACRRQPWPSLLREMAAGGQNRTADDALRLARKNWLI